jgi:hypothetical protein
MVIAITTIPTSFIAGSLLEAPLMNCGSEAADVTAGAAVQVIVTVAVFFTV